MKMTVRRAATSASAGCGSASSGSWPRSPTRTRIWATRKPSSSSCSASPPTWPTASSLWTVQRPSRCAWLSKSLGQTQEVVVREGLVFSWPKPTAIIPDENCVTLRDFLGCNWVAEEYCLTPDEIQSTYKIDVGKSLHVLRSQRHRDRLPDRPSGGAQQRSPRLWHATRATPWCGRSSTRTTASSTSCATATRFPARAGRTGILYR